MTEKPEELPDDPAYQERFRAATKSLIKAGPELTRGLVSVDIVGAYFSAGVSLARQNLPSLEIADLLRNLADDLDDAPRIN